MDFKEFGNAEAPKIVLIPGSMMCWKQFDKVIPLLEKRYRVIAVSTDGFDGTGLTTFTTAKASAKKLTDYLTELRVLKKGGTFAIHDILSKARYGDMLQFINELFDEGYERVQLIDTTTGKFMTRKEAALLMLGGSALLIGKK